MPRQRVSLSVPVTAVCALLVTAAALVGAWQFGQAGAADSGPRALPSSDPGEVCLHLACPVVASATVGDRSVELHATADGRAGALAVSGGRTVQVKVTDSGARLDRDSLSCVASPAAGCMVSGDSQAGKAGEVFLLQQSTWQRVDRQYLSSAGMLGLRAVDGVLSVVAVQLDCGSDSGDGSAAPSTGPADGSGGCSRVDAQVFTADGRDLGCTQSYPDKYHLPRYPDVEPRRYQLSPCTDR